MWRTGTGRFAPWVKGVIHGFQSSQENGISSIDIPAPRRATVSAQSLMIKASAMVSVMPASKLHQDCDGEADGVILCGRHQGDAKLRTYRWTDI